jgi:hypothetical protein
MTIYDELTVSEKVLSELTGTPLVDIPSSGSLKDGELREVWGQAQLEIVIPRLPVGAGEKRSISESTVNSAGGNHSPSEAESTDLAEPLSRIRIQSVLMVMLGATRGPRRIFHIVMVPSPTPSSMR